MIRKVTTAIIVVVIIIINHWTLQCLVLRLFRACYSVSMVYNWPRSQCFPWMGCQFMQSYSFTAEWIGAMTNEVFCLEWKCTSWSRNQNWDLVIPVANHFTECIGYIFSWHQHHRAWLSLNKTTAIGIHDCKLHLSLVQRERERERKWNNDDTRQTWICECECVCVYMCLRKFQIKNKQRIVSKRKR